MLKKFLVGTFIVAAFALVASSASADCSITTTLKVGSKGAEVSCLQAKVGATADGSFGPMTKASVMAYQSNHGLSADGVVGPLSRAILNGAVSGNFPAGCTSASGFSATTGLSCVSLSANTFAPPGCTNASGFSPITGGACYAVSSTGPCSAGALFNSTTGASCSATPVTPVVSTSGEGSVTVTYDAVPATGLTVLKGENKSVMAIKIKATGSDMKVSRLWLDINTRIWLSADNASLLDGSTVVASLPLSASTVTETTVGSAWQLQFNGLNVVVPVGTTKILTLTINRPTLTQNSDTVTIAATSTLRATDGAGISNTYTLGARSVVFSSTGATTGTLTTGLSANSPAAQSVAGVSATAGILTAVKLMDFDLKSKDSAINVTALTAGLTTTAATLTNQVASLELRDGTSVLASATGAASVPFTALSISVAKDSTKTLSLWAQMNPIGTADAASTTVKGAGITASITASTIVSTDASFVSVTTPTTAVTGNTQYMYQYAPTFTLGTVTQSSVEGSKVGTKQGNYSIAFTVAAPTGSDIYVDTATTLAAVTKTVLAMGGTLATSSSISGVTSVGTSGYDKVGAGLSRIFTFTGTVPDGGTSGFTGMKMVSVKWNNLDSASNTVTQNWGLSDFKTTEVYVTAS